MYIYGRMKVDAKKIISSFLLFAFVFAITPKEFIHALSGHEDTVHHNTDGTIAIGTSHTHCQILQLQINPFIREVKLLLPEAENFRALKNSTVTGTSAFVPAIKLKLRGPPTQA